MHCSYRCDCKCIYSKLSLKPYRCGTIFILFDVKNDYILVAEVLVILLVGYLISGGRLYVCVESAQ